MINDFLSYFRTLDRKIWPDGDRLRYDALEETLTPNLRAEVAQPKGEILASLSETAASAHSSPVSTTKPVLRDEASSLSIAQERLWFLEQLEPANPLYNIAASVRLVGHLNVAALRRSLNELIRRHQILRTSFASIEGQPVQVIAPILTVPLPLEDLVGLPVSEREAVAQRVATEKRQLPFDLERGPLLRANLLRLGEREHILVLSMHHIISDGWSMDVFWRELAALYEAFSEGKPSPLAELPVQYTDFAFWQRQWLQGEVLDEQLGYWKQRLADVPALELPTDYPRPAVQTFRGTRQELVFPEPLTELLKELGQREGATMFMVLLAAFQALLCRYTGQEDIAVGSPVANRNRTEIEGLIGFFVNTLALRTDLSGDPTFGELLERVREATLGAYDHQDLPFEKLVEELDLERDLSRSPLLQVMFALQNGPRQALELADLTLSRLQVESGMAKFDLTLFVYEEPEGLRAVCEYNTDLFAAATIERTLGHFRTLLEGIVENPKRHLSELPILTEAERRRLLVEWNDTEADYPKDKCVHELFEAQVERTPDAVAVVFEDGQLTYRELNRCANRLAHRLRTLGVGPEVLVGICAERSLEMVVGLLGILKAGGAYVPLDPSYPKERLAFMLEDARAPVVLAQAVLMGSMQEHGATVVCLDADPAAVAGHSEENPTSGVVPNNLAYVIYTSGSTGNPKGAMNTHQGICNRLLWMQNAYRLTKEDRVLQKTPFSFDVSVWEFFWPLLAGARLIVARPGGHRDSAYLVDLIAEQRITTLHFVPSMLRIFLKERGLEDCTSLKRVMCSGEPLPFELQECFFARSGAALHNLYGPTEAAIDVTFWACERGSDRRIVPIGCPIANTKIYLLDRHLQPVPIGFPGELHIGGAGLARGYLNRPELTVEKFILNPFSEEPGARLYQTGDIARYLPDGSIEYLGRIDHQVKIRGFRVELGEIEAALNQHSAVQYAVVLAREDIPGDKRLVAYIVPNSQHRSLEEEQTLARKLLPELRSYLQKKLPEYMVPSAFTLLDEVPLTPNGKVDRKALPSPEPSRAAPEEGLVAPRTPAEEILTRIWAEVLGLEQVGIHDDFFELGGHSLLAVSLFAQIEKAFGQRLPLATLIQASTVEQVAEVLVRGGEGALGSSLAAIQPYGSRPPFFCVHGSADELMAFKFHTLAQHLGTDQPFYGFRAEDQEEERVAVPKIEDVAAARIRELRELQPEGPYLLGGFSLGAVVVFEMARQLRERGQDVALLAVLDGAPGGPQPKMSLFMILRYCAEARRLLGLLGFVWTFVQAIVYEASLRFGYTPSPDFWTATEIKKLYALRQAAESYEAQPYSGRVTLFKTARTWKNTGDPTMGWDHLVAGGVEVHEVPGDHVTVLEEPHVRVLAAWLKTCLDRALVSSLREE